MTTRTYVNGKIHVRRKMCSTCIFRPENKGRIHGISDERIEQMVRDATRADSCIPCHHHLYQDEPVEPVCRGFYDKHPTTPIRLAAALDIIEFIDD